LRNYYNLSCHPPNADLFLTIPHIKFEVDRGILFYLSRMNETTYGIEIRWADMDPNFHLRHSVYYDYGAYCRIQYMSSYGITAQFMHQHSFGPILFREEAVFKKEIKLGDKIVMDIKLLKASRDYARWTMQHEIFKNNEIVAAIITLDGAWIDTHKRKLCLPPPEVVHCFEMAPRSAHFVWTEK
jgi:acyl-CoA thioester hydrolase